jgi:hypothetical protein
VTEETQDQAPGEARPQDAPKPFQFDPAFFACVNEFLDLTSRQSKQQSIGRTNMASLYAAARFNAHVYMVNAGARVAAERTGVLDYMSTVYRRMLNEHLDALGAERGVDVGESELAAEYAAAGFTPGQAPAPAADDSAAG